MFILDSQESKLLSESVYYESEEMNAEINGKWQKHPKVINHLNHTTWSKNKVFLKVSW